MPDVYSATDPTPGNIYGKFHPLVICTKGKKSIFQEILILHTIQRMECLSF